MRLLFLGAGATGGYFGGRLAKAGADVTFLVRPKRRDQLRHDGLRIESPLGDLAIPVKAITRDEIRSTYDAVIVSAKAYDLDGAIDAINPAVGDGSLVLPLLNGMKHFDALDAAFGTSRVLGGLCHLSVTLTPDGTIRHFNQFATVTLGARFQDQQAAAAKLHETLAIGIDAKLSSDIAGAIWEKWCFIAAFAASTCLMRAPVGDIVRAPGGPEFMQRISSECTAIAVANGHPLSPSALEFVRSFLGDPKSVLSASMLRDIQHGSEIESDQIVGDIIRRGRERGVAPPLLETAYLSLEAYRNGRATTAAS